MCVSYSVQPGVVRQECATPLARFFLDPRWPNARLVRIGFHQFQRTKNAHIGIMTMSIDCKIKETPSPSNQDGSGNTPSGFILKLFQMVNGAPDEVISVSTPTFSLRMSKISDSQPTRLESSRFHLVTFVIMICMRYS